MEQRRIVVEVSALQSGITQAAFADEVH